MSKLIIEMEMPRACPCELATEIEGNFYPCFAYYGVVERAVEFDKCMSNGKRPDWCPIKGVLPDEHGDLIDRDAYLKLLESYIESKRGVCENKEFIVALQAISKQLKCVNAVIAAERKDNDK